MLCRDEGVLITGDTVYATDHELIDWYPGSSVGKMTQSVERILHLANAICLALPGHNDVLTKDELEKACENHLRQSSGTGRKWRKGLSRTRANIILAANSRFNLPSQTREWIKN
jgi:glyoxylase-like metal-dependent hydrolase (beta-lactamase superfamily II)